MGKVSASWDIQGDAIIEFDARGRTFANEQKDLEDGAEGFTSGELLLTALGNCSIRNVLYSPALEGKSVSRITASIVSDVVRKPTRIEKLTLVIDVETDDPDIADCQEKLQNRAEYCPVANTLRTPPEIQVEVRINGNKSGD